MTDDQNSQKMLWIVLILSMLNLVLTRRIYSTVDVFTVICMTNNTIIWKNYHPSYPLPSEWFINNELN